VAAVRLSYAQRRQLTRKLSAILDAEPFAAEAAASRGERRRTHCVGFSGPPGAGKSSVIGAWAKNLLDQGRSIGVLAVDPSSPISSGALLGDRVRMDAVSGHPAFFLRSVASRSLHDGLCPNAATVLDALEDYGFDQVVLETVGVGQADYSVRSLVDTFVMVLNPEGGDIVQAMKAGILEVADILVVNKSDLPSARRMSREIASVLHLRPSAVWQPPVVETSATAGTGFESLQQAIASHATHVLAAESDAARSRRRDQYRLHSALAVRVSAVLGATANASADRSLAAMYDELLDRLKRV